MSRATVVWRQPRTKDCAAGDRDPRPGQRQMQEHGVMAGPASATSMLRAPQTGNPWSLCGSQLDSAEMRAREEQGQCWNGIRAQQYTLYDGRPDTGGLSARA